MSGDLDQAVIVALGGNLAGAYPSTADVLRAALARLGEIGLKPVRTSSFWRSSAWPNPRDPEYLNAVALVETALAAPEALAALHRLETTFGNRSQERNAARVLDLDLIAFGRLVCDDRQLSVPHPRAAARRFVMAPLAEIAPGWRHPVLGRTAAELAASATVGAEAQPVVQLSSAIASLQDGRGPG